MNAPRTFTLAQEDDDPESMGGDPTAADIAEHNLNQELQDTAGMSVTVYACPGGPNRPQTWCFTKPWSDFMQMDDLRGYVQKHYGRQFPVDSSGSVEFRAHFRKAGRLHRNIPFNVSPPPAGAMAPVAAPQDAGGMTLLMQQISEMNARNDARFQQLLERMGNAQAPINPMQQIKDTLEIIKPFLPAQGTAPTSPGGLMEGFQQFREMRDYFKQELTGLPAEGGEAAPWWAEAMKEAARSLGPVLAGIMAAAQARGAARGAPATSRDVTPPTPALPPQENPMSTDPQQAAIQILAPFADRLGQLDMAAKMMSPADKCAVAVLDQTPEEALPVLEGLANPSNRDHALAAVFHYVPAARDRFAWWDAFMQAIYADLTAPSETETLTPSNPG